MRLEALQFFFEMILYTEVKYTKSDKQTNICFSSITLLVLEINKAMLGPVLLLNVGSNGIGLSGRFSCKSSKPLVSERNKDQVIHLAHLAIPLDQRLTHGLSSLSVGSFALKDKLRN